MSDLILVTENLTKQFGGLSAVNDVSLSFKTGQTHAILGPNGAGKSTLVDLFSGDLLPTSGRIFYKGKDITRLPAHRVSQLNVGRSYQRTNIFPHFTCFENCWLAAQSRLPNAMRFFRPAYSMKSVRERTKKWLKTCGLNHRRDTAAASMSYGEQRQLEIAMVLATEPELLLLDEPTAGMGRQESENVVSLLKELSKDYTLILIEHDMDAVFALCELLTVMVDGRVLESGTLQQIRNSVTVQKAYLGDAIEMR